MPPQHELFEILHGGDALLRYAKIVLAEWPDALGHRYVELTTLFKKLAEKSPDWREFNTTPITRQEAAEIPAAAKELAEAISDPETAEIIAPEIPAALEKLAEPLAAPPDPRRDPMAELEADKERLAVDVVNAMENILQRVTEAALWAKETQAGKVAADGVKKFGTEFGKEFPQQMGKLGKLMAKLAVWGPASGAAWLIAGKFAWFVPIAEMFKKGMKAIKP